MQVWGLSKKNAHYAPASQREVRCDQCKYMFPRLAIGGCRLVRGIIKNSATCTRFDARKSD